MELPLTESPLLSKCGVAAHWAGSAVARRRTILEVLAEAGVLRKGKTGRGTEAWSLCTTRWIFEPMRRLSVAEGTQVARVLFPPTSPGGARSPPVEPAWVVRGGGKRRRGASAATGAPEEQPGSFDAFRRASLLLALCSSPEQAAPGGFRPVVAEGDDELRRGEAVAFVSGSSRGTVRMSPVAALPADDRATRRLALARARVSTVRGCFPAALRVVVKIIAANQ